MAIAQPKQAKSDLIKYHLSTAQYLNGKSPEKRLGEIGLKQLSEKGRYTLVRDASTKTLSEKKFQPVR